MTVGVDETLRRVDILLVLGLLAVAIVEVSIDDEVSSLMEEVEVGGVTLEEEEGALDVEAVDIVEAIFCVVGRIVEDFKFLSEIEDICTDVCLRSEDVVFKTEAAAMEEDIIAVDSAIVTDFIVGAFVDVL